MLTIDMSAGHYAVVCNLNGHYAMGMHQDFNVVPAGSTPITVGLGETDATHMFIDLSQPYAPEGKVTFIITNQGAEDHEFVVLQTDTMAADFPIVGFEGEPNRFNEDAKGITNVGETGDPAMKPGTSLMLTIDMTAGHYAVVCNLNGHYAMGMHQDFNVVPAGSTPITVGLGETDATHMFIDLSQPVRPRGQGHVHHHEPGRRGSRVRGPADRHHGRGLPDRRVRRRAEPLRRGRQGHHQRRGDRRSGDEAGHLARCSRST